MTIRDFYTPNFKDVVETWLRNLAVTCIDYVLNRALRYLAD